MWIEYLTLKVLDVLFVSLDDLVEILVLVGRPVAGREHFHFDPVGEACGGFDELADAAVVDATFAHQAAVVEHVLGWSAPVADVEGEDPPGLPTSLQEPVRLWGKPSAP